MNKGCKNRIGNGSPVARRLRSRSGESLTEVLVAVLISAVALVMLAMMVATASRLIQSSQKNMEEYRNSNQALANQGDTTNVGTVRFQDGNGTGVEIAHGVGEVSVYYYENSEAFGNNEIVSYRPVKDFGTESSGEEST